MSERSMARLVPVQTYARLAGVLFLVSFVAGGFGEGYVPSVLIVSGDALATAKNIAAQGWLFRLGVVGHFVEALCDVGLTWVLYILLRPVDGDLALLAVFVRLISTAGFAMAQVLYYAALPLLGGSNYLKTFSPDQLGTLALLFLRLSQYGGGLFSMFYGVGSIVLGYLMVRSGFLPRILGVLFALSGVTFTANIFLSVLAPRFASPLFLLAPMAVAGLSLMLWLLVKGVDVPKWQERAALADGRGA